MIIFLRTNQDNNKKKNNGKLLGPISPFFKFALFMNVSVIISAPGYRRYHTFYFYFFLISPPDQSMRKRKSILFNYSPFY